MENYSDKLLTKLRSQSVKSLMDIILLSEAKKSSITGYDAMNFMNETYGVLISAGTIYAHLYSLERDGLMASKNHLKSRTFEITETGNKMLEDVKQKTIEVLETFKQTSTSSI